MKMKLTEILIAALLLTGCDNILSSIITPDPGSYKTEQNRLFGNQLILEAEAKRLGKTSTAEYACETEPRSWMRIDSFGGKAMVAQQLRVWSDFQIQLSALLNNWQHQDM